MSSVCVVCGSEGGFTTGLRAIDGKLYCIECGDEYIRQKIADVIVTTTSTVDGWVVSRYLGIESIEIVVGTGPFSEFHGAVSDFFGARSTEFEQKLQNAKRAAVQRLQFLTHERGGHAVIGVDLDFIEFSGNRIGVIANGTVVQLARP